MSYERSPIIGLLDDTEASMKHVLSMFEAGRGPLRSRGKLVAYKTKLGRPTTNRLRCSLPIYDIPDLVSFFPSFFFSALTYIFAYSILHKIGNILFGPPAFSLVDTDRP